MNFEENEIALRYAKSICEYAIDCKLEKELFEEVVFLNKLLNHDLSLITFCSSPLIDFNNKSLLIKELTLSQFTKNFLLFILYKNRFSLLIIILDKIRALLLELNKTLDVELITAKPINDKDLQFINNIIKEMINQDTNILHKIDETILGGLIIKMGSKILDASLAKKITTLRDVAKQAIVELRE